jgi:hypothetical protein
MPGCSVGATGRLVGLAIGTMLLWPFAGSAELATDGALGRKITLDGKEVTIRARLSHTHGRNRFHSVARFGIEAGGKITFTGPDGSRT